jgi:hypothetical protein
MSGIDAVIRQQLADEGRNEAHVVDALPIRHRGAATVGPAEVDPIGIGDGESVRVGHGVVVRERGLVAPGGACRVQIDDQTRRMRDTGRHVNGIGPGQSPEIEVRGLQRGGLSPTIRLRRKTPKDQHRYADSRWPETTHRNSHPGDARDHVLTMREQSMSIKGSPALFCCAWDAADLCGLGWAGSVERFGERRWCL